MTDLDDNALLEIDAMREVAAALKKLNSDSRGRVLKWAAEAFKTTATKGAPEQSSASATPIGSVQGEGLRQAAFTSIADLFAATQPSGDAEKALVASYWVQIVHGEPDFDSQTINNELKHLGHRLSNITQAFGILMNRKPQLAIQTRKSGSSQQARKRYKLTTTGQQAVDKMISTGGRDLEAAGKQ
ncbi:MAG TPA: hypothetical protein VF928_00685 [Usitatibacteraceae bacterium]